MNNEMELGAASLETVFCDRSVFDAAVYVGLSGDSAGEQNLHSRVAHWADTYHKIFIADPADVPHQEDNVRSEDSETRLKIHEAFVAFFERNNIPFELLSGTVEQRISRVDQILKE